MKEMTEEINLLRLARRVNDLSDSQLKTLVNFLSPEKRELLNLLTDDTGDSKKDEPQNQDLSLSIKSKPFLEQSEIDDLLKGLFGDPGDIDVLMERR